MATPHDLAAAGLRAFSNPHCTATALDLGATVLSWRPAGGDEVLFLSRDAAVGIDEEVHGGIPICAPWFGRGRAGVDVPRPHGLVRWVPWRFVGQHTDEAGTHVAWELDSADIADVPGAADYPADLHYRHEVSFGAELELRFTVSSPSTSFVLDEAFHCYFSVPAAETRVLGLEGAPFRDHFVDPPREGTQSGPVVPDGPVDLVLRSSEPVTIATPHRDVVLHATGAASVVVWNPGPDVPADFAADEWPHMVCVEVGNVQADAVTVPAGGSHTLALRLSVSGGGSASA